MKRLIILTPFLAASVLFAQTRIVPPDNDYTPAQDVQLGREAAAEAEKQLPIMHDDAVSSYIEDIGRRLVTAIPPELRHPEFQYSFKPVNVREINAFALPGGPMFVNRGMIEAAKNEGEVAGVMAHELSHVVLRHGTAQAKTAQKYQIGQIAGAVLGAIIGGRAGSAVAQVSQFGIGAAYLRFPREYEKQADLEGSQIMARAGYDPRDMANMFKTIEKSGGSGGPQWLSDHPNPGNRYDYITQEAQMLRVENPVHDTRAFDQVKTHLKRLPPAPTTEQATKNAGGRAPSRGEQGPPPTGRVDPPSSQFTSYTEGGMFRISVPSNWRELQSQSSITFAPEGGYGQFNGSNVFTHGVEVGVARNESHDLQTATDELLQSLGQGNPQMRRVSNYRRGSIGGRSGLTTTLSNVSEATGAPETIQIFSTLMRDGNLLYLIAVAPSNEFSGYQNVFQRVAGSLQFMDTSR
jgi:Zn-dependent protease with chaperone function